MMRLLASVVILTLVYTLTLASFAPWDLLFGALLAAGVLVLTRQPPTAAAPATELTLGRLAAFVPFAVIIARNIIVGTWRVMLVVLHLRPLDHPGIIAVPIGERTRRGVAVSALAETLSPGSFLVDVDWEHGVMLVHLLDASNPTAIRDELEEFYERYQRPVFP